MDKMTKWPYEMGTYNHDLVRVFCVQDQDWQKIRLSMKGIPTYKKLEVLRNYRNRMIEENGGTLSHRHQVQIDNYINALKRGGQLDMQMRIQR